MLKNLQFIINIFDSEVNRYIFYFSYFAVAMIYMIANMGCNKKIEKLMKLSCFFLILLCIPFYTNKIKEIFDDTQFFFIFWIIPIEVITCYAATEWFYKCKRWKDKMIWVVLSCVLLILGGQFAYGESTGGMPGKSYIPDVPLYLEECEEICSLIAAYRLYAQVVGDTDFKRTADVYFAELNVLEEEGQESTDIDFYVYNKNHEEAINTIKEIASVFYETKHYLVIKNE